MKRTTFKDFKKKALQDTEVKAEYDAPAPLFNIKKQLINARTKQWYYSRRNSPYNRYFKI